MEVNSKLKEYIQDNILSKYDNIYSVDGIERIEYVLKRSEEIINENNLDVDYDLLYTAICYHDIRVDNNEENHELSSANYMFNDEQLRQFLNKEQLETIKKAIEDQRANLGGEPRNIYGKILSSASRNTTIGQCFERAYKYGKSHNPDATEEEIFEKAYEALNNKFGQNGYAKFYFQDPTYERFLFNIRTLLSDKNNFIKKHKEYIQNGGPIEHIHSIIIIKKDDKFLNYYDERWDTYFFPNIKGNNIDEIKEQYNVNEVKLLFDKVHEKYSVPHNEVRTYHHYFYEIDSDVEGEYYTLDDLLTLKNVKENNNDIINFLQEYYKSNA